MPIATMAANARFGPIAGIVFLSLRLKDDFVMVVTAINFSCVSTWVGLGIERGTGFASIA